MSLSPAPDDPAGESGVSNSSLTRPEPPLRIVTRPWFWGLVLCVFWLGPLYKSLTAEYPDPIPGFERSPEVLELLDDTGRQVSFSDLGGYLLIIHALDMSETESAERDFALFRRRKDRLRGLGSLVVHVILTHGGDEHLLSALIDQKTARKPNNVFLLDPERRALSDLQDAAGTPSRQLFLLDRHARLRGAYGADEQEGDRFAQNLGLIANWIGSDPEIGQPVYH